MNGDGGYPAASLVAGPGGMLYAGDRLPVGSGKEDMSWTLSVIHHFANTGGEGTIRGGDGFSPNGAVTLGLDGRLYGTTN